MALQAALWEPDSKVDRGLKRLIAHVAARVAGCRYCQAHTASGALHFGVDDAKLAAIGDFGTSPLFTPAAENGLRSNSHLRRARSQQRDRRDVRRTAPLLG